MRPIKTSLFLLCLLPTSAFAQELDAEGSADASATGDAAGGLALEEEAAPAPAPAPAAPAAGVPTASPLAANATAAPAEGADAGPARPNIARSRGGGPETGTWSFNYAGYFRAPMRIGFGETGGPQYVNPTTNPDGEVPVYDGTGTAVDANGDGFQDTLPKQMSIHNPVIPDDQYASWQFTPHNKKDWAEMFFSVGNGVVSGTLAIQGFQFTDAAWKQDNAQFGIGQGWVEINHDLGFENVKFNAKVGSFWSRYGMAGQYDSGEYDTYLIGRTHVMGGTARMDIDMGGPSIGFEAGVGTNQPNPEMFNRARFTTLVHGHAFLGLGAVNLGLHGMHAFAAQAVVPLYPNVLPGSNCGGGSQCVTGPNETVGGVEGGIGQAGGVYGSEYPNGSQTVLGVDAKFDLGIAGSLFAGFSQQLLSNSLVVGDAIESIHSLGAGEYTIGVVDNYLESSFCAGAPNDSCSNGTGGISSAMVQYELGLANFGVFSGAQDLKLKLYGMLNAVQVDDIEIARLQPVLDAANATAGGANVTMEDLRQDGVLKLKGGVDAEFFALDWLSIGVRFDHLSPNSKVAEQAFSVLSPRITFRSQMVTHETITLQYSRYMYAQRECTDPLTGNAFSPAADNTGASGATYSGIDTSRGLPGRIFCTQPAPSASIPQGFGSTTTNQPVGMRGAPTLLPDENVIKLEASMWF